MTWNDTGVWLVRSNADPTIWTASVPMTDMATAHESAAKLRACKRWVEDRDRRFVHELDDDTPTRWRRLDADTWVWEMWT